MITADFHTHSNYSTDCDISMEDMILQAIHSGLTDYCFTDHMDYLYSKEDPSLFTFDPQAYAAAVLTLKEKYKNQITIRLGIELGLRNEAEIKSLVRDYYQALTTSYPFDFIIGSTHQLFYGDPYEKDFWKDRLVSDTLTAYFTSILENISFYQDFDVYGHLDYLVRYLPVKEKDYAYSDYQDLIDLLLKSLIEKGKGIECNTSGYFYGLSSPHPKAEILKRYRALGGEILTIGSDAHKITQIGYDFNKACELLKSLGYRYYTVFDARNPMFYPL